LTGLSALGLALSAYLGWHYVVGGSVIGCSGGSSCDQVLGSRWSAIGGVLPVSGLAAGAYLAMLLASLYLGPATEAPVRRLAWRAMLVLVGAAAGSAVWFSIVQKWVIGAFCPYCMATHVTGLVLAALVIWRAPRQFDDNTTDVAQTNPAPAQAVSQVVAQRIIAPLSAIRFALLGVALAAILAVGQVAFRPTDVFRAGESPDHNPTAIDPHTVPLLGSPDAPYVVTLLFDYECPHCQKLHSMLDEVIRRYGGKVAFVLCPAPLNTHCNPYIPRDVDVFKDSCELTKIALAVWVAKREAFPDFDRWMYSPEPGERWHARSLDAAKAKAVELVGQAKFDAARADPWIAQYMQTSVQLYGDTGADAVPKLVFGSSWVNPDPNDADDLISILQDSLAVPKP
jgi:uncharacterized membrane protein/thiol-disulfide isomerase/thioredoxin